MIDNLTSIYNEAKEKERNIFAKFLSEINFHDIFAYSFNYRTNICTIHSSFPGVWIGLYGKNVMILKRILREETSRDWDIDIIEVRGNFVSI